MRATVKRLGPSTKTPGYSSFFIQIRGRLPTRKLFRERYTTDFRNEQAAYDWANERIIALAQGRDEGGRAAPTLEELWGQYKSQHVEGQRLKPSQKRALESIWSNHLEPCFGSKRIDQIGYEDVQAFKASRSDKAPKTVNNVLIALKAMLRFAAKIGRLELVPAVELLKVTKALPVYYDVPTYNKLVAAALNLSDRHAAIVLLGGDAGLRAGEMIALDRDDFAPPMLMVRRAAWRGHMGTVKGHAERMLPLTQRTVDVLTRLAKKPGPILRTQAGGRMVYSLLQRALRQAQDAAKVPRLSLHKLRHTYGTDITRALGIRAAQALLGHSEVTTTERYAHVHAGADTVKALEKSRAESGQKENDANGTTENTE